MMNFLFFALLASQSDQSLENQIASLKKEFPQHLYFALPNKISAFDPQKTQNAQGALASVLVFETLLQIGPQQEFIPILAESWTVLPKNKLKVTLKEGLKFSDGSHLDSSAVKKSFALACELKTKGVSELTGIEGCAEMATHQHNDLRGFKILNERSFELSLTMSAPLVLYELTRAQTAIVKNSKASLFGSGPYRVARANADYSVLERNPYYRAAGEIRNPGVVLFSIEEDHFSALFKSLQPDGTIMFRAATTIHPLPSDYQLVPTQGALTLALVLNLERFPFNETLVRKYLLSQIYSSQISRCTASTKKAYGFVPIGLGGSLGNRAPKDIEGPSAAFVRKSIPRLQGKGVTIEIHRHQGRRNDCEASVIGAILEQINVRAKFVYHESYDSLWPLYEARKLDAVMELYVFSPREAFAQLRRFHTTSHRNVFGTHDPTIDRMIESVWGVAEPRNRYNIYRQIGERLISEAYLVPIYYSESTNLIHKCIVGVPKEFVMDPFMTMKSLALKSDCRGVQR